MIDQYRETFESRISAAATENLPGWDTLHAKSDAWSHDMEGHAQKCVERCCELAHKKRRSTCTKFHSTPCLDGRDFGKEEQSEN